MRPCKLVERLPQFGISALLAEVRPTVIVCDIEGGELGLFDNADLSSVRQIVLELHPKIYGDEGLARILGLLAAKGLHISDDNKPGSTVQLLERLEDPNRAANAAVGLPPRHYRDWPIADPRVLVVTCMKDEGPFILEWLAWHRAVGITDFTVFSNDCTDGTDPLLDHLQEMGELTHLPNPALATVATAYQPIALAYVHHMRQMREADFFISMDVDEFINVRTGDGKLSDLFAATGPFDVLSMSELNHGANQREHLERGWLKDQFPLHQSEQPGHHRSRRGVKSIVHLSERVVKLRNHRPDLTTRGYPPLWLDGTGRYLPTLASDPSENGIDCRGTYGLVSLDHFSMRSLDSYLVKMFRGDVVVTGRRVSRTYWRVRNRNEVASSVFDRADKAAPAYHRDRFESDPVLMELHEASCVAHERRIEELKRKPDFMERRNWALTEVW